MRKALSSILTSLLFLAPLFGIPSSVDADKDVRGHPRIEETDIQPSDIQPSDRSDREVIRDNTYGPPEDVDPPGKQATGDADSYRQSSQRPHRFGAESSYGIHRFRHGR